MKTREYIAAKDSDGQRIDLALPELMKAYSRAQVQRWIREGLISINGKEAKKGNRVKEGDRITLRESELKPSKFAKKNIPLQILFEDQDLLVINKPAGLLTHPSAYEREQTLVNALLFHCHDRLSGIGGELRPGIVHRLDKDTSGVLLVAKHDESHHDLARQMENHQIKKEYLALVKGIPKTLSGTIEAPLGRRQDRGKQRISSGRDAKSARTHFQVQKTFHHGFTLLKITLETGRMHQIRVHLAAIGHPIVGDRMYGDRETNEEFEQRCGLQRQFLHAFRISFSHPSRSEKCAAPAGGQVPKRKDLRSRAWSVGQRSEKITVEAPLPADLLNVVSFLDQSRNS